MGLAGARPGPAHRGGHCPRADEAPLSVLLITRSDDNACVDMVSQALLAGGAQPVRLDTDRYPTEVRLSSRPGAAAPILTTAAGRFDLSEVTALWYRRFLAGGRLPASLGDTREASVNEARRTLYGTIASLDAFQLDPLMCVRKTDHKELQLKKAREFGLDIPATLITNDPSEVREFYARQNGQVITKMQSSFAIYRPQELVVYTNLLRAEHLDQLDGLQYCPMTFQELIEKRYDLRATVVGKRVFTAAVDAQHSSRTQVDWRRDGVGLLEAWRPYQLPPEVESALLRLVEFFGLNYAAADFATTDDGRHVFLEINAGGEWFWLQRILPIAEALSEVLRGTAERAGPLP